MNKKREVQGEMCAAFVCMRVECKINKITHIKVIWNIEIKRLVALKVFFCIRFEMKVWHSSGVSASDNNKHLYMQDYAICNMSHALASDDHH